MPRLRRVTAITAPWGVDSRVRFDELYATSRDAVYGFVLARCGDPSLAEEITADAFINAWKHMFATGESLGTGWVITAARRRLIDHWRRRSVLQDRISTLAATARNSPHESLLESDDSRILEALQSLPDRQRAVVALRYLDEFSVSEIAETLSVTYKTVESLLSRGRSSLRTAYKEIVNDS